MEILKSLIITQKNILHKNLINMKTAFILLLVLFGFAIQAQTIEIPLTEKEKLTYLRDTVITIGTLPANTGQIDSFGYVTTTFPSFIAEDGLVTMEQVDNLWNSRNYTKSVYIVKSAGSEITYKTDNRKWFAALRNRKGIALFQRASIYKIEYEEKTEPQKFWYLYEYMIDNGITNETFWNAPQVKEIINPVVVIPETPQDSI